MNHKLTVLPILIVLTLQEICAQRDFSDSEITKFVLLGTGTPNASPFQSGPSIAIVVNSEPYIIDFGPGLIRRAAAMSPEYGGKIEGLKAGKIKRAFLTHLHSDHTVGLPDLLLSPWVLNRAEPLSVYGPAGIDDMMEGILGAWAKDIEVRLDGLEPRDRNPDGYMASVHEIEPGLVYEDDLVRIHALRVQHGAFDLALGYRIEGPDRTIVISGDATPSESIIDACDGCDILLHEVFSAERLLTRPAGWQSYHSSYHTSTVQLADVANRARPGLLVLYHHLMWGTDEEGLIREIRAAGYSGPLVSGRDLDVY